MGGPDMAPQVLQAKGATPPSDSPGHTLGAPRRSRGTPRYSDRLRANGGPRHGPPGSSSEGGYAPLGLPRPHARGAPAKPGHPPILRQLLAGRHRLGPPPAPGPRPPRAGAQRPAPPPPPGAPPARDAPRARPRPPPGPRH